MIFEVTRINYSRVRTGFGRGRHNSGAVARKKATAAADHLRPPAGVIVVQVLPPSVVELNTLSSASVQPFAGVNEAQARIATGINDPLVCVANGIFTIVEVCSAQKVDFEMDCSRCNYRLIGAPLASIKANEARLRHLV
jgi:hypothetical protein